MKVRLTLVILFEIPHLVILLGLERLHPFAVHHQLEVCVRLLASSQESLPWIGLALLMVRKIPSPVCPATPAA